eukprot:s1898_g4.t1
MGGAVSHGCCKCDSQLPCPAEMVEAMPSPEDGPEPQEVPSSIVCVETPELEGHTDDGDRRPSIRLQRLNSMSYFEVDTDIVRGIPLARTLQSNGWLWKTSPIDMEEAVRQRLWGNSRPTESFGLFLSHTWHAPGSWKVLSLRLQFGWHFVILAWLLTMSLVVLLGSLRVLPMPTTLQQDLLGFHMECPAGPWAFISSCVVIFVTIYCWPSLVGCFQHPTCFFDVVSISQSDKELQVRGIYGLGGFLKISKELLVLLHPAYLSRLWCLFELAAYRKANPGGLITVRPLFIEQQVFYLVIGATFGSAIIWGIFVWRAGLNASIPLTLLALSPLLFIAHTNRKLMMEKHRTISGLERFSLADVHCRLDKDRVFILTAISEWYGSEQSFVDYVKGPLRREVVAAATNRLPFHYALLTVLIPYSVSLDVLVALIRAGAPFEAIMSEFVGSGFGWVICWQLASVKLLWVLCDRLAAPRSYRVLDYLVSLLIFLAYFIFVFAGYVISDLLYSTTMWGGFAFAGFASLLVLLLYRL